MTEHFYFLQTIDPCNPLTEKVTVRLSMAMVKKWEREGLLLKIHNIETIKKVLDDPKRIFYGTRAFNDLWWCYAGKPDTWYVGQEAIASAPFPKDCVFTVLMDSDFEIYGYQPEKAATDDPLSPIDWKNRYGRLVWQSTN